MEYLLLLNASLKSYLLTMEKSKKKRLQEKLDFLANGMLDTGVRVKKLKGAGNKVVFEARLTKSDRLLFTLGRYANQTAIYLWGIVKHDDISQAAAGILPDNAPFLNFEPVRNEEYPELVIEDLRPEYFSQEALEEKSLEDYGPQKWLVLEEGEWQRILKNSDPATLELFLYLTGEQQQILTRPPPILLSGTAGSGKTTLSVYYLLDKNFLAKKKLYLTYSPFLKKFSSRIYHGLVRDRDLPPDTLAPEFYAFPDLLARIFSRYQRDFEPLKLVGLPEFEQIFKNHQLYKKYDAELVWEEIRSIIKGAHPQLSCKRLQVLLGSYFKRELYGKELQELQDYLASLANFEFITKIDRIAQKKTRHPSYSHFLAAFPRDYAAVTDQELFLLQELLKLLEKKSNTFNQPLLTFREYEALGRKRAPNFLYDRQAIYTIAEYYQGELESRQLRDEIDCCRDAARLLKSGDEELLYDLVVCDEVQDFTDVQLGLIFRLCRDYRQMLLTGDPRQIINPSGFRWEELKARFYERNISVPEVYNLKLNFRCVGNLVRLANSLLELKQQLVGLAGSEFREDWKFNGRPPVVVHNLREEQFLASFSLSGAGQVILVRDKKQQSSLRRQLGTELIFTINEAKGLEFDAVLLWKFSADKKSTSLWRRIGQQQHLPPEQLPHLKHELNLLYVAVTRARSTLLVYDGATASPLWQLESLSCHFHWSDEAAALQELWQRISSPEEWNSQGEYFLERLYYKAAGECFKNAGNEPSRQLCEAYILQADKKFEQAAVLFRQQGLAEEAAMCFESAACYREALELWQQLKRKKQIQLCRIRLLEQQAEYDQAAEEWLKLKKPAVAAENWKKARNYPRLAAYYFSQKNYTQAVGYFEQALDFTNAAVCYKKLQKPKQAAEMYYRAGDYRTAAVLYKKLKITEALINCYRKLEDYLSLGRYFEKTGDDKQAIIAYENFIRQAEANRQQLADEAEKYGESSASKAAVRYAALGDFAQAAQLFLQRYRYALAADYFELCGDYTNLAQCRTILMQFYEAACAVEQSPLPDKWQRSEKLLRHYVRQDEKYNRQNADKLCAEAEAYEKRREYQPALVRYKAINYLDKILRLFLQLKTDEEAISYFLDYDTNEFTFTGQYLEQRDTLNLSDDFIRSMLKRLHPYHTRLRSGQGKEIFFTVFLRYLKKQPVRDKNIIAEFKVIATTFLYSIAAETGNTDVILEILFEIRAYNLLFELIDICNARYYKNEVLLEKLQARCLELSGQYADKNFLVCAEFTKRNPAADSLLQDLEITHDNDRLFHYSEASSSRLIEFYLAEKNYEEALTIARLYDLYEIAESLYEKTGEYREAGTYFKKVKKYKLALKFFHKAKDWTNIARVYENQKEFAKAMQLWRQLGKQQQIDRLKVKLLKLNISLPEGETENFDQGELF